MWFYLYKKYTCLQYLWDQDTWIFTSLSTSGTWEHRVSCHCWSFSSSPLLTHRQMNWRAGEDAIWLDTEFCQAESSVSNFYVNKHLLCPHLNPTHTPNTGRQGPSHRLDAIYPQNILIHIFIYLHKLLSLPWMSFLPLLWKCAFFFFLKVSTNDIWVLLTNSRDFPGGSNGKESACNAGNLGSIPGSGSSPGKGNSYPLQHSWLENPMDRGAWWDTVHGVAKSHD